MLYKIFIKIYLKKRFLKKKNIIILITHKMSLSHILKTQI